VVCSANTSQPPTDDVTTQAQFTAWVAYNEAHAADCRKHTGKLYDFVDTLSVVRDMDAIRSALGEQKLNYYGVSYGTMMGERYAEKFPQRTGRFVLDSNMDHSQATTKGFTTSEARAAQAVFGQFVDWCGRTQGCALHGSDVRAVHRDLLARAERGQLVVPGSAGGTKLTPMGYLARVNDRSYRPDWFSLAQFMKRLHDGVASPAVAAPAADPPGGPQPAGDVPDPFAAIFCQDWALPVHDFADLQRLRKAAEQVAPDMKVSPLAWLGVLSCLGLQDSVRNPQHTLHVKGADPFLFANARFDPATPLDWAIRASRQAGQTLLTYDGWGHGAYDKSPCMRNLIDRYLATGELPAKGTHCAAVEPTNLDTTPARTGMASLARGDRPGQVIDEPPVAGGWLGRP
jgi:pimeloyl-ACP methyl ester carboxylesterase